MSVMIIVVALSFLLTVATALLALRWLRRNRVLGRLPTADTAAQTALAAHPARAYPALTPTASPRLALLLCLALVLDLLITSGAAAFFQRRNIRTAELLRREGVVTRATVVDLEIIGGGEDGDTYHVTYSFVSRPGRAEEREVTIRDGVSRDVYKQLEQGGRVEVIYAPSDPEVVRITADYDVASNDYRPTIVGAMVVLPTLGALAWFFTRYRRGARLDEEGVTATAEVLDLYEDTGGEVSSYYIAYRLPGGDPFRHTVRASVYRRLQVGSPVTVRYLPDDPRVFRLEGE